MNRLFAFLRSLTIKGGERELARRNGWVAPRNGGHQAIGPDIRPSSPPPGPGSPSHEGRLIKET